MIPQHLAPRLSALDLTMARAVPPGGNWKDIPTSVPSQRLAQIRASYARGEGSRSTYYGRLRANEPSYTISTYFARPGNGCHLHYDPAQNRTLSYREAARLQSFPDAFVFSGSKTAIARQIGNAVPPLLGLSLARVFGEPGAVVDLFAGAGGLSLGFHWAGWRGLVATDLDAQAMKTFAENVHPRTITGDIRNRDVRDALVERARAGRRFGEPLLLIGGPPCQGFSTAGNHRTRDDARNGLFRDYCAMVEAIDPDAFLFENVTGMLNMEGGAVFREITAALGRICSHLDVWRIEASSYDVPQRRKRVVVVGVRKRPAVVMPESLSGAPVTVADALGDLPPLMAAEDGSSKPYRSAPVTAYQRLMRGASTPDEFLAARSAGRQGFSRRDLLGVRL